MAMEYRAASRVLVRPDSPRACAQDRRQGPRARNPATPEGVTDDLIEAIFAPLPADEEWTPLP
jgi:enoyl-CoA hydratase